MLNQNELINMIICNNNKSIELWTCCFYHKDPLKKILKNIHPQKVKVTLNKMFIKDYQEYPSMVCIKNSDIIILDSNNKILNYYGNSNSYLDVLSFFEDEEECQQYYNSAIYEDISKIELEKEKIIKSLDNKVAKLKKQFYKSDYMMEKILKG